MPKHFYSKYPPEKFNEQLGMLMGTGPYMLRDPEAWRPGTQIELDPQRALLGRAGPFNRIIYNEVVEEVAALTMFRNGELDRIRRSRMNTSRSEGRKRPARTNHFEVDSPLSGYATSPGTRSATASRPSSPTSASGRR
jgi:ABC-type transport system substrate-binding protein